MNKCHFYYKVETEEGFKYYGIKILTKDINRIDEILDQINVCGTFIKEEEFNENINIPMELDITDNETESIVVGTIIFEAIDLDEVTDENEVKI